MSTATKTRIKKPVILLPKTREELEALVAATIGIQTDRERLVAERDKAVIDAGQPYAAEIAARETEMKANLQRIELWAENNRETFGELKSIKLGCGRIGWSLGNWKATLLSKVTWQVVLSGLVAYRDHCIDHESDEMLEAARRLIRTKEEPNKEAMIEHREDAYTAQILESVGVEIIQEETFYLKPDREGQADATLKAV